VHSLTEVIYDVFDFFSNRFKFPTIFIVYQTIAVLVYSSLSLIGWVWRKELLCKSRDLTVGLNAENTTIKCKIIGKPIVTSGKEMLHVCDSK